MQLEVSSRVVAGRAVLALTGSLDLSTVPALHNALTTAIVEHPAATIAVDLQNVDSLDDVALGVLLGGAGRARRGGGDVIVVTTDEVLRQRLSLTGFDRAVTIATTLTG